MQEEVEANDTEFKTGSGGRLPKEIWQTISAFSNCDDGKIIIGVTPEGKRVGLNRTELDKLQQDFASLCNSAFSVVITQRYYVEMTF